MLSVIFTAECGTVLLSLGLLITLRKLNIAKANPVFRCLVPLVATFNVLRIPGSTSQKRYRDLDSDASSVLNFCARFSDVTFSRGNLWWRREMSAVFSG